MEVKLQEEIERLRTLIKGVELKSLEKANEVNDLLYLERKFIEQGGHGAVEDLKMEIAELKEKRLELLGAFKYLCSMLPKEKKETEDPELSDNEKFFEQVKGKKIRRVYWAKGCFLVPDRLEKDYMSGRDEEGMHTGFYINHGFTEKEDGSHWIFVKEESE